jgi:hypothetical protein
MDSPQAVLIPNDQPPLGTKLRSNAAGRLTLVLDGIQRSARARLCFPWSDPRRHFSLRDDDDNELVVIADPADLDPESRLALEQALAEAGFVFEVTRVVDIDEEIEIRHWRVETRQGPRSFQTHLDDWPRELPGGGRLVRDVAGDLYLLADPKSMDRGSRELLWAFVD